MKSVWHTSGFYKLSLIFFASLLTMIFLVSAVTAEDCSIVGSWTQDSFPGCIVTCYSDGMCTQQIPDSYEGPNTGTWVQNGNVFTISWNFKIPGYPENFIDYTTIGADCNSYSGYNQYGGYYSGTRNAEDCNIVGNWTQDSFPGCFVTCYADGTCTQQIPADYIGPNTGTWVQNGNVFTISWNFKSPYYPANFIDYTTLGADCNSYSGHNQYGGYYTGTRNSIQPPNQPPVAKFKSLTIEDGTEFDGAHSFGGTIIFDASESFDPDSQNEPFNGIKEYRWDFGPNFDPVVTTIPRYKTILYNPEKYTVTLTVLDDDNQVSEPFIEEFDLSLKPGDLIFVRSGGKYTKLFSAMGLLYTHVGMYVGPANGQPYMFIESAQSPPWPYTKSKGVQYTPPQRWSADYENYVDIVRVNVPANDPNLPDNAVEYAKGKLGSPYDIKIGTKQLNEEQCHNDFIFKSDIKDCERLANAFYCSELIWVSYLNGGGFDLNNGLLGGISPDYIIRDSGRVHWFAGHHEKIPT